MKPRSRRKSIGSLRSSRGQPSAPGRFAVAAILVVLLLLVMTARKQLQEDPSTVSADKVFEAPATPPQRTPSTPLPDRGGSPATEWMNRGIALLQRGQVEEAIKAHHEAVRLDPTDEDLHYNLGIALARGGRTDAAISAYQEALRLFPNYVEAHNNLGNLFMREGRLTEAIEHFRAALATMPDYASAHNNLGTALRQQGDLNAATIHFEQAVRLSPDYWQARYNLGLSYLGLGRLADAKAELDRVTVDQPGFLPGHQALEWVEERRKDDRQQ